MLKVIILEFKFIDCLTHVKCVDLLDSVLISWHIQNLTQIRSRLKQKAKNLTLLEDMEDSLHDLGINSVS